LAEAGIDSRISAGARCRAANDAFPGKAGAGDREGNFEALG